MKKELSTIRVAAAQIALSDNPEANTEKIIRYIEKAGKKNVDIVCFPENCISTSKDEFNLSPFLERIRAACKREGVHAIVGASTRTKSGKVVNRTFILHKGRTQHYDKKNLWKTEKNILTAGTKKPPVFNARGLRGSVITCWDMAFPEFVNSTAKEVDFLVCSTHLVSYKGFETALRSIPQSRAFENNVFFILCDAASEETMSESVICSPQKVLARIKGKEGLITAEIQKEELERINHFLKESEETYLE